MHCAADNCYSIHYEGYEFQFSCYPQKLTSQFFITAIIATLISSTNCIKKLKLNGDSPDFGHLQSLHPLKICAYTLLSMTNFDLRDAHTIFEINFYYMIFCIFLRF